MKKNNKKLLISITFIVIIGIIIYAIFSQSKINNVSIVAKSLNYNADRPTIEAHGLGDVNDDGKIDKLDEQLIQGHLDQSQTLTSEQQSRADINGDGQITVNDAQDLGMFLQQQGSEGQDNTNPPNPPQGNEGQDNTNPPNPPQGNEGQDNTNPPTPPSLDNQVNNQNSVLPQNTNDTNNSTVLNTNVNTNNNISNQQNKTPTKSVIPKTGLTSTISIALIILIISTAFFTYKYKKIKLK